MNPELNVLDATVLESLRSLGERTGRDLQGDLARIFLAEGSLDNLRAACEAGDTHRLGDLAHKLKGSSSAIGAQRLAHCCCQIQGRCDRGEPVPMEELGELVVEYTKVETALQDLQPGGPFRLHDASYAAMGRAS